MKHFTKSNIKDLEKVKRLNIINSITGIKPGNLIGTISKEKITNLAIFSSVIHLGSNPALLGFILRPQERVRRDTYNNILENGSYTINHLPKNLTLNGHYTSAKFDEDISEFEMCKIEEEFIDDFYAPFVKESNLKLGMELKEVIPIKSNESTLVVGEVKQIYTKKEYLKDDFMFDLEKANSVAIGGLNEYFTISNFAKFPHVTLDNFPNF